MVHDFHDIQAIVPFRLDSKQSVGGRSRSPEMVHAGASQANPLGLPSPVPEALWLRPQTTFTSKHVKFRPDLCDSPLHDFATVA